MRLHTGIARTIIGAAWLFVPFIAFSQDPPLSLKHGVYVNAEARCRGAPNAGILFWDGTGFSGAHSSRCKSRVLKQSGARFQIDTTCKALGDGSPSPLVTDYVDSFLLTRLSSASFEVLKGNQIKATYRWRRVKDIG
jgi:hypothetical protein